MGKMSQRKSTMITFFYSFIVMGSFFSIIGSAMPMMREEYGLNYSISGVMMSALSAGYLIAGATVNIVAKYLGKKRTYVIFSSFLMVGLALMMFVSNEGMLLFSAAIAGLSRGCIDTYGNRMVSVAAQGNDAPINFLQACYSMGTCIAPLITLACGGSWRTAFTIIIVLGIISVLLSLRLSFDEEEAEKIDNKTNALQNDALGAEVGQSMAENISGKKSSGYGFFKSHLFWQSAIFLVCYISIEDSLIGWIVTFFADSNVVSASTAQLLASVLYAVIMVGRIVTSGLAVKFKPKYLLIVMSGAVMIWFTLMVFSNSAGLMIAGLAGLGLFMAGIYGATLAGSSELIEKYPLCMGMFITIPGIGAVLFPGFVGIVSNSIGVRNGLKVLYIVIALMLINAIFNLKKKDAS